MDINDNHPICTWENTLLRIAYEKAVIFSTGKSGINKKKYYHYTSIETLQKIINDNTLLLTHCQFLNDSAEFISGSEKIIEILDKNEKLPKKIKKYINVIKKTNESHRNPHRNIINSGTFTNRLYHQINYCMPEAFSISFCERDDLRYQWQTYAGESGISIEFDFTGYDFLIKVNEFSDAKKEVTEKADKEKIFIKLPGLRPLPMIYKEKRLVASIATLIDEWLDGPMDQLSNYESALAPIFFLASFYKNKEFKIEKEHRIALREEDFSFFFPSSEYKTYYIDISYTLSEGVLKPRMTLSWQPIDADKENSKIKSPKSPIKAITVGPGKNQDFAYKSICHFLDYGQHKIEKINKLGKYIYEENKNSKYGARYVTRCGIEVRKSKSSYLFPRGG